MESSGATTTTPGRKIMVASSPTTAPTQAGSYSQGLTDDNSSNKRKRTESTNGTTNNNNSRNNSIASRKNKTNATSSPAASASASAAAAAAAAAVTIKAAERTTFDSFWGQGRPKENGMRVEYDGFNVNIGRDLYEIAVGDAVMLRTYNPNANPNGAAVSASGSAGDNDYKADDASSDNPSDYYKSSGGGGGGGGGNGGTPGAGVGGGGMTMIQHRDPKTGDNLMLARVEKVWQEKGRSGKPGQVLFQARWLLKVRTDFILFLKKRILCPPCLQMIHPERGHFLTPIWTPILIIPFFSCGNVVLGSRSMMSVRCRWMQCPAPLQQMR